MAEPYSDEELEVWLRLEGWPPMKDRLFAAIRRLQAERDEARRLARTLAKARPEVTEASSAALGYPQALTDVEHEASSVPLALPDAPSGGDHG